MRPNSSLQCRNLSIAGSSAAAQNATIESNGTNNTITVNGNLVISSGGKLDLDDGNNSTNDAILILKGNFINNATDSDVEFGNSTMILNGTTAQIINIPANSTLFDLVINNTMGAPIIMNNDLRVERLLTLQNGKLDLNGKTLMLGTSSAPATVLGGNANSYIISWNGADNGSIIHNVPSNTASYLFPMGDENDYTPFEVILNQGNLSNATLTGKLRPMSHPNLGMADNYLNRYWIIEPSGISDPLYDVVYGYAANDVVGTDAFIFPAKYNAGGWQSSNESGANAMIGNGDVNTASRIITWVEITTFSEFTGMGSGTALPIELLEFSAEALHTYVQLNWITASESNNSHFIIERSINTVTMEEIAKINGAVNSNSIKNYQIDDTNPIEGISYYRLRQVDFDGNYSHSEWVAVNFAGTNRFAIDAIFVSKSTSELMVKCSNPIGNRAEFQIFESSGRLIENIGNGAISANWTGSIPLSTITSGSYILRFTADGNVAFRKFIIP